MNDHTVYFFEINDSRNNYDEIIVCGGERRGRRKVERGRGGGSRRQKTHTTMNA